RSMENSALGLNSVGMSVSGCVVWSGVTPASVLVVIEAGQPGGEALDGGLELRVEVDERSQLLGQPVQGDLVVATPAGELLDTAVGEVHEAEAIASRVSRRMRPAVQ